MEETLFTNTLKKAKGPGKVLLSGIALAFLYNWTNKHFPQLTYKYAYVPIVEKVYFKFLPKVLCIDVIFSGLHKV